MKTELAQINFTRLLHYAATPKPQFSYHQPPICDGFCVSCEEKGLLAVSDHRLYLMSHGADTSDFEVAFGCELPIDEGVHETDLPVMFVLESPGGDKGNGVPQTHHDVEKQPPTLHYYWMPPEALSWPDRDAMLSQGNLYGPYFAYLLRRFGLKNAYFTNAVKCGLHDKNGRFVSYRHSVPLHQALRDNCFDEFLNEEVRAFQPKAIFAFGDNAHGLLRSSATVGGRYPVHCLYHPSARNRRKMVEDNDSLIQAALDSRSW